MLIYSLSLFNSIFFIHSHWYEGNLVALHAHPYNVDFEGDGNKNRGSHSQEEFELYDLIYNSTFLEVEFFDIEISPVYAESKNSFFDILISFESNIKPFHFGRGPPVLI